MATKRKPTARKTTITKEIIKQAEQLASKAYGVAMIADALGIAYRTCFNNKDISEAIKRGKSEARQKVVDDLMARSEGDQSATSSIFLAKQLKVFDNPYPTATPKSVKEAVERIGNIYKSVASGELDQEKGDRLVSYLDKLVKGIEISQIEVRLTKLEEANGK